jgi:probable phosphoglycerate mutase
MIQVKIYFDGGYSSTGPYGSYHILSDQINLRVSRKSFPDCDGISSCNTAEYLALLEPLQWLAEFSNLRDYSVEIFGDSMLVVNQVSGRWKTKKPHLKPLCFEAQKLLTRFGAWTIIWHGRKNSVERFGH